MSDQKIPPHDPERQPYFLLAGEIVAAAEALRQLAVQRRPALASMQGPLVLTYSAEARRILVCLRPPDGAAVLLEAIQCDPHDPRTFGSVDPAVEGDLPPSLTH